MKLRKYVFWCISYILFEFLKNDRECIHVLSWWFIVTSLELVLLELLAFSIIQWNMKFGYFHSIMIFMFTIACKIHNDENYLLIFSPYSGDAHVKDSIHSQNVSMGIMLLFSFTLDQRHRGVTHHETRCWCNQFCHQGDTGWNRSMPQSGLEEEVWPYATTYRLM